MSSILFVLRTSSKFHLVRLPAILSTWAAALPRLLIITDDGVPVAKQQALRWRSASTHSTQLYVISSGCPADHESGLCCKTWRALVAAYNVIPPAPFVHIIDDDAYVFVPNLLREPMLQRHNAKVPLFLGNAWCKPARARLSGGAMSICGGGTYLLSRRALQMLLTNSTSGARVQDPISAACRAHHTLDDAALNVALEVGGVHPTHSHAFHFHFRPPAHRPPALSMVRTERARAMASPRPVSFHLRNQPPAQLLALHGLLCSSPARRALWSGSINDAEASSWCQHRAQPAPTAARPPASPRKASAAREHPTQHPSTGARAAASRSARADAFKAARRSRSLGPVTVDATEALECLDVEETRRERARRRGHGAAGSTERDGGDWAPAACARSAKVLAWAQAAAAQRSRTRAGSGRGHK